MRPELYTSFLFGSTISPECILIFSLLLILLFDLIGYRKKATFLSLIALTSLVVAEAVLFSEPRAKSVITFLDLFGLDEFGRIFQSLIVLSSIICVFLSIEYIERTGTQLTELLVFILMGTIGAMFLCSANDLVTIFVSLECLSLCSYLLCSYTKKDIRSNEAAIKYLLMGGLNSSIFAYGFSWLYGLSGGQIDIKSIASSFSSHAEISDCAGFFIAFACIAIGIAFKLSLVPFHQWTPDIYEGSPTPVVAFLSVTSKIASVALAIRIFNTIFLSSETEWKLILEVLAISSMVLGNLVAITQTSMKRMLAYSSISQIGYIIIGLVTGDSDGCTSTIVYIFFYIFMSLGTFACVISVSLRTGTDNIRDYEGLYTKDPLLSLSFTLCLLSLGGFPPLTGFFGKLYLFWCGWRAGLYLLIAIALVTSIFSIYYYLKIIKSMIYSKNQLNSYIETCIAPSLSFSEKKSIEVVMFLCAVGATFFGSLTGPIRDFIQDTLGLNLPFLY